MNIPQDALDAMTGLMQRMSEDPTAKQAYEAAVRDLQAFLQQHQYFGEAAVMVCALALSQDEQPNHQQQQQP